MKANYCLENLATTLNDLNPRLPKGRGRCFDIGQWGGCGVYCAAFVDGECEEAQEFTKEEIIEAHGDDAIEIFELYDCFKQA